MAERAQAGRPRVEVDIDEVERMLNARYTRKQIAEYMQCSVGTISSRLRENASGVRHHLHGEDLLQHIRALVAPDEHGRGAGHRLVQSALFARAGIRAPREQVLEVLRAADPAAVEGRSERILPRRTYTVDEAMILWHIDSYEKLKMYGLYVHAGIDGGSNFVVYVVVATDKRAATLFTGYSSAVACFGRPVALRADMAFEATPIGQDMLDHVGVGSYLCGPSTANQRIENFWNYMWSHLAFYYRQLFAGLEQAGHLDRHDPADLYSLTTVFRPRLQHLAENICIDWNHHTIRPQARRGIVSYVPVQRMHIALQTRPNVQADPALLNVDLQLQDGSFSGGAANDAVDRGLIAIAPADGLLPGLESTLRDNAYRGVIGDLQPNQDAHAHVSAYLEHRKWTHEVQSLRAYQVLEQSAYDWSAALAHSVHMQEQWNDRMYLRNINVAMGQVA